MLSQGTLLLIIEDNCICYNFCSALELDMVRSIDTIQVDSEQMQAAFRELIKAQILDNARRSPPLIITRSGSRRFQLFTWQGQAFPFLFIATSQDTVDVRFPFRCNSKPELVLE